MVLTPLQIRIRKASSGLGTHQNRHNSLLFVSFLTSVDQVNYTDARHLATNDDCVPAPDKIPQTDQPFFHKGDWGTTIYVMERQLV